jgi:phage terminase large subunit GpA-like protein
MRDVSSAWRVPPVEHAADWIPRHLKIPITKESPGPFDLDKVPHVRFVLEMADRPSTRAIFLRWAARGSKTTTALALLIFRTKTKHLPAVFVSCDEARVDDTIETDLYPMLDACPLTRADLLPERKRKRDRGVQLGSDRIRRAFAGSPSTLAGFPAATIVCNEVSKFGAIGPGRGKNETKSEAHPIHLARQRGKLFPWDSLFIAEGTPARKGDCVVSSLVDAPSTQRWYFHVPCPHCGTYQRLQWAEGYGPYKNAGVKWEKGPDGHTDALIAERTAYYECVTACRIENADRPLMMRSGVWVAEGQTIKAVNRKQAACGYVITGEPLVDSADVAFDELSTLYSLLISGWGQLAGEWARALGDPERVRDFINSTLARQYDAKPIAVDPHVVARRICVAKLPPLTIPSWAVFLTGGFDVQQQAAEFPFVISAWGPGGRGHKVAHGFARGFDGVKAELQRRYVFDGSNDQTGPLLSLIDSGDGNYQDVVYDFCGECLASGLNVMPSKGSSTQLKELDYSPSDIEDRPGMTLIMVNTFTTNPWLQRILNGTILPSDPLFYSLPEADQLDLALIAQLCNGQYLERRTDLGRISKGWDKIFEGMPDDLRDGVRYSRVAAQVLTQHGTTWNTLPPRILTAEPAAAADPVRRSDDSAKQASPRRDIRRR